MLLTVPKSHEIDDLFESADENSTGTISLVELKSSVKHLYPDLNISQSDAFHIAYKSCINEDSWIIEKRQYAFFMYYFVYYHNFSSPPDDDVVLSPKKKNKKQKSSSSSSYTITREHIVYVMKETCLNTFMQERVTSFLDTVEAKKGKKKNCSAGKIELKDFCDYLAFANSKIHEEEDSDDDDEEKVDEDELLQMYINENISMRAKRRKKKKKRRKRKKKLKRAKLRLSLLNVFSKNDISDGKNNNILTATPSQRWKMEPRDDDDESSSSSSSSEYSDESDDDDSIDSDSSSESSSSSDEEEERTESSPLFAIMMWNMKRKKMIEEKKSEEHPNQIPSALNPTLLKIFSKKSKLKDFVKRATIQNRNWGHKDEDDPKNDLKGSDNNIITSSSSSSNLKITENDEKEEEEKPIAEERNSGKIHDSLLNIFDKEQEVSEEKDDTQSSSRTWGEKNNDDSSSPKNKNVYKEIINDSSSPDLIDEGPKFANTNATSSSPPSKLENNQNSGNTSDSSLPLGNLKWKSTIKTEEEYANTEEKKSKSNNASNNQSLEKEQSEESSTNDNELSSSSKDRELKIDTPPDVLNVGKIKQNNDMGSNEETITESRSMFSKSEERGISLDDDKNRELTGIVANEKEEKGNDQHEELSSYDDDKNIVASSRSIKVELLQNNGSNGIPSNTHLDENDSKAEGKKLSLHDTYRELSDSKEEEKDDDILNNDEVNILSLPSMGGILREQSQQQNGVTNGIPHNNLKDEKNNGSNIENTIPFSSISKMMLWARRRKSTMKNNDNKNGKDDGRKVKKKATSTSKAKHRYSKDRKQMTDKKKQKEKESHERKPKKKKKSLSFRNKEKGSKSFRAAASKDKKGGASSLLSSNMEVTNEDEKQNHEFHNKEDQHHSITESILKNPAGGENNEKTGSKSSFFRILLWNRKRKKKKSKTNSSSPKNNSNTDISNTNKAWKKSAVTTATKRNQKKSWLSMRHVTKKIYLGKKPNFDHIGPRYKHDTVSSSNKKRDKYVKTEDESDRFQIIIPGGAHSHIYGNVVRMGDYRKRNS